MYDLVRVIAALAFAAGAACSDREPTPRPPPPQRPGVEGLVEFLDGRLAVDPAHRFAGCVPSQAQIDELVTPAYRGANPLQVNRLAMAWYQSGPATARLLYADDPTASDFLRRSRPALPVGQPPLVAKIGTTWVPALFVFHGGRWLCLGDYDPYIADRIHDACRTAYLRSSQGRCLDFTAPLAEAVLTDDRAQRERLCALLVEHGCGSVPAEAPDSTP